jgi:hypothetical protein
MVAALALWVTCKTCMFVFDSGLRMDRVSFDRGTLAANYHTCPNCGTRDGYRKADYELRDVPPRGRSGPARR